MRTYGETEAEADRALSRAIADYRAGHSAADANQKLDAYLNAWVDRVGYRLKPATGRNYELNVRLNIIPYVGQFTLGKLQSRHVQRMVDAVTERAGARTARAAHATLHKALRDAIVVDRVIDHNAADAVKLPSYQRTIKDPWQLPLAAKFLDLVAKHPDEAFYLLATMHGPRPYEILGLTWDKIDLDGGVITINTGIQWPAGESYHLDKPKTEHSVRKFALAPRVIAALRRQQVRQEALREAADDTWIGEQDWVFTEDDGRPRRVDTMSKRFRKLCATLGMPKIRLYDLRRIASSMISSTSGPEAAMRTLGHSSIKLAMEQYSYQLDVTSAATASAVERLLKRSLKGATPSDTPSNRRNRTSRSTIHARKTVPAPIGSASS